MILIKHIRTGHPYRKPSSSDRSYTKIADTLMEIIHNSRFGCHLTEDQMKSMAIKLTHYFEDVVSEIGTWQSFIAKHLELYGKPLPFYKVPSDYDTDEIHLEDIKFLLWDATLENEYKKTLVNPENEELDQVARIIFNYLDDIFEDTPINEVLYDFFHNADFTDDFYKVRHVLKWFFFDCYLTSGRFKTSLFDREMEEWFDTCRGNSEVSRQAAEVAISFFHKIGPLALKPQEWLSALLSVHGHKDKAKVVAAIEADDAEPYLLLDYDPKSFTLRNSEGKTLNVRRTDYCKIPNHLLRNCDGCVGCYARYNEEWFLNGMNMWTHETERTMLRYKEDMATKDIAAIGKTGEEPESILGEKKLFFFRTGDEFRKFRHEVLKIDKEVNDQLSGREKNIMFFCPDAKAYRFCTILDCAEYIKHPDNPMYDPEKSKSNLLIANLSLVPGEFIRYAIANNLMPDMALNSDKGYRHGKKLTQDNLDFLARTLRRHEY